MIMAIVWLLLAYFIGKYAAGKGRNGLLWGLASLFFSPLLVFIVLLLLGDSRS